MGRAFLGLGSNLGEKETFLREAVDSFQNLKAVSGIYETEPVGGCLLYTSDAADEV